MAATLEQVQAELASMTQRLTLSEQHGIRLASQLDAMRAETETALRRAKDMIDQIGNKAEGKGDRMDLADLKHNAAASIRRQSQ